MKRSLLMYLLPCALLCGFCTPGSAQNSPSPAVSAASYQGIATVDLISEGKGLLQRGRRLQRAIELFQEAVKRTPDQAASHIYAGTAYAARAFALSRFREQRQRLPDQQMWYGEFVQEWERMQKTDGHPLASLPPPASPPTLNPPEPKDAQQEDTAIEEEIQRLTTLALTHLTEGNRLLAQDSHISTETRIELLNLQGWSALLLITECYRDKANAKQSESVRKLMEDPLEEALKRSPDDTQQRSTGDAFILAATYRTLGDVSESNTTLLKRGLTLIEETAPRARNRGATYYWIALQRMRLDEATVIDALAKAARYDTTNAIYNYTYAAALIKQRWPNDGKFSEEDSREILATMRRGNTAPTARLVAYAINTPKLLRWTFADYAPDSMEITRRLGAFAELEFRKALEQTGNPGAFDMTKELAKAGVLFYKSSTNSALTSQERRDLLRTGRLLLSLTGILTAGYRIRTHQREALPELGFTVSFATPALQQAVEKL